MEYESLDRGFHPNRGGAEFTVDEATVAIRNHQKPEASRIRDNDGESCLIPPGCSHVRLTDRASAAATCRRPHNPTFLRPEATASCMRMLGCADAELFKGIRKLHLKVRHVVKRPTKGPQDQALISTVSPLAPALVAFSPAHA